MGTEKYPDENDYKEYLSSHGGNSNAFTAKENTNYFFDVTADHFEGTSSRPFSLYNKPYIYTHNLSFFLLGLSSSLLIKARWIVLRNFLSLRSLPNPQPAER